MPVKTNYMYKCMLFIAAFFPAQTLFAQSKITQLKCEHLDRPIGIDAPYPRLSWELADSRQGAIQTAYQLFVSTDSLAAAKGTGNLWQTAKVNSSVSLVTYAGKPLQPFTKYFWAVTA